MGAVGAVGAEGAVKSGFLKVLADRRILIFCGCAMLFTFANAPMLMLVSGTMSAKVGNPSLLIAACIVLPQIIVALASPYAGRLADRSGRRLVLMLGFCVLPLRCLVFALSSSPRADCRRAGTRRHRRCVLRRDGSFDRE